MFGFCVECLCIFAVMKKYCLFILMGLLFSHPMVAEIQYYSENRLSDQATISLLTASPGSELYSVFGHSALWVYDPVNQIDEVYNWGTFDFDTPNFYVLFVRGQLMYMLTISSLQSFLYSYMIDGRSVESLELNLLYDEKLRIYDYLQINRQPENIHYLYDFFYDNCATRIRDLIDNELHVDWGPDPYPQSARTFRQMLKPYVNHIPWIAFGIDVLLGLPSDRTASPWHYMFLPDEMDIAFQQARHQDGRLLVTSYEELLPYNLEHQGSFLLTPTFIFWLLLLVGCLSMLKPKIARVFDKIFFSLLGLSGLLLILLWLFSDHIAVSYNLNLLWAIPTHIYFIFRVNSADPQDKRLRLSKIYFRIVFFTGILLLVSWPFNPQGYHPAFFPIIILMSVISWKYAFGIQSKLT